jgi:CDP-paratose 2-epimerase
MKCTAAGRPYMVHGCKGKQVRDNLHAADLVEAFLHVWRAPRRGGCVYNMGGGRDNHCSMLEAIDLCQRMAGRRLAWTYRDRDRRGDHVWYVSSRRRFELDYPGWRLQHGLEALLRSIHDRNIERWTRDEDALPAWEPVPARLH